MPENEQPTFGGTVLPAGFAPRVPIAGTIKIGEVTKSDGKSRPVKLDHFRYAAPQPTGAQGNYPNHPDFEEENATKPHQIPIRLFLDDVAGNLETRYQMASALKGRILCTGDGGSAVRRRVNAKGELDPLAPFQEAHTQCGDKCPYFSKKQCKFASALRFEIPGHTPLGKVWIFRTNSRISAEELVGSLNDLSTKTKGRLARIPLHLAIVGRPVQVPSSTGLITSIVWTVSVEFRGTTLELARSVRQAREEESEEAKLLAELGLESTAAALAESCFLGTETPEEEAAVAMEFFADESPSEKGPSGGPIPSPGVSEAATGQEQVKQGSVSVSHASSKATHGQSDTIRTLSERLGVDPGQVEELLSDIKSPKIASGVIDRLTAGDVSVFEPTFDLAALA